MNKYIFGVMAMMAAGVAVHAQSAYDAETMINSDLNGTSRYVGMGGALGALGADLSTMGGNPAGTGLIRSSDVSFTFGGQFTGNSGTLGHDAGRGSIDQAGVLFAFPTDGGSVRTFNFGVNYQKRRNFLSNLETGVLLNGGSQTFQLAEMSNYAYYDNNSFGILVDATAPYHNSTGDYAGLYNDNYADFMADPTVEYGFFGVPASAADYRRATSGSNAQVDFNLSTSINDQLFLGLSVGVYSMVYDRQAAYYEIGTDNFSYTINNWYHNSADGVDVKLGAILRPIEDSPLRFGFTIHTPIWYHLRDYNSFYIDALDYQYDVAEREYNFRTPWKFGFSLGHTVSNCFAFGVEYELQDYSSCKYYSGSYNNYYNGGANLNIKENLQTVHTLKVGMEVKPADDFALRLGYNYVSSPFKSGAYNMLDYNNMEFSETDYTNWGATNRITFGVGYRFQGGYFDLAYQYQMQKGDFYAYDYNGVDHVAVGAALPVNVAPMRVSNNRSQIMATLGFKF